MSGKKTMETHVMTFGGAEPILRLNPRMKMMLMINSNLIIGALT
jgi:hypothetical protein